MNFSASHPPRFIFSDLTGPCFLAWSDERLDLVKNGVHYQGRFIAGPCLEIVDSLIKDRADSTWVGLLDYELLSVIEPSTKSFLNSEGVLGSLFCCQRVIERGHEDWSKALATLPQADRGKVGTPRWNPSSRDHIQRIREVRERIRRGDFYQANIARSVSLPFDGDPLALYLHLARSNPGPYCAYMDLGERQVLSLSPELLITQWTTKAGQAWIRSRPIKGTIRRGSTEEEDQALSQSLLDSQKDRAELTMIVDLMRNDLGKICRPGTVRIGDFPTLTKHASVWHLECDVVGQLKEDKTKLRSILEAVFPAGSITGAPKIAAAKAIAELERGARRAYCGSMVKMTKDHLELNVNIRTFTAQNGALEGAFGGGITWRSDEQAELAECADKAKALLDALTDY